jgi:WD40 repeat protein
MNTNDMHLSRRGVLSGLAVLGAGVSATLIGCQELPTGSSRGRATATVAPTPTAVPPGMTLATFRTPGGTPVPDVVWSPDSQRLAYCTWEQLRICDIATRRTLLLYQDDTLDCINALSWFSTGTGQLSYLGWRYGPLQVLEPASGNTLAFYDFEAGSAFTTVYMFAWSPDGKRVALASDYSVTVRDAVSGQVLVTYPRNPPPGGQPSYIVAWSPDGKTIASAGRTHAVQFWEAATGRPLHYFPELAQAIAAAWSPDGRCLAYMVEQNPMAYEDQLRPVQIIVREVSTAREVLSLAGSFGIGMGQASTLIFPHSLAWSPDSRYLAMVGHNTEVQVWEVERRRLVLSYGDHRDLVQAVAWSPNGRCIASAARDGMVLVWGAPGH